MSEHACQKAWPLHVQLCPKRKFLHVEFSDGSQFSYSAEYLRVEKPSGIKGHGYSQKYVIAGCKGVGILSIEMEHYAVRIFFDDETEAGIYSWDYLYALGENQEENWQRYLCRLQSLELQRQ